MSEAAEFEYGLLWLVPFLPLVGAVINGTVGLRLHRRFGEKAINIVGLIFPWASCCIALFGFIKLLGLPEGSRLTSHLWVWMAVGEFKVKKNNILKKNNIMLGNLR